jgi:16S rRNA processing protein RimM
MPQDWDAMALVGVVARPHGLRGQVVVNPETDFPDDRFRAGAIVFVRRGTDVQPLTVASARLHQGRPVIGIAGIASVDDARGLAGLEIRVPVEWLERLPAGSFYRHDLVGCEVVTGAGTIVGVVRSVDGAADGSRLSVGSERGEILIPLAAAICVEVDLSRRRVVVDPPDGLLELNWPTGSGPAGRATRRRQ